MSDQLSNDLASLRIRRDAPPRGRGLLKALIAVGVLGIVGVFIAFFVVPKAQSAIFKTEISTTEVLLVSPAQASISVTSTGYVIPQVVSNVGSKLIGRISKVMIKEGDSVKAGDTLVELDDLDQRTAITTAQAKVSAAQARATASRAALGEVKQQIAREQALVDRQVTGRAALDDLTARLQALEESAKATDADVRAAAAEAQSLQVLLKDRKIVAPIAGTIVTKPPEVGEMVDPARPIVEIVDFSSLVVETDVPETRLHLVTVGKPCEVVLDAYPAKRYRCETLEIGRRINRAKATVPIKVKFTDTMENVLPEMSARVSFLTEALSEEALKEPPKHVVPQSAVVDRLGAKVVFVVDQGQVKMVPIRIGLAAPGGLELLDGPAPGTRLVANPPQDLQDGQKIKEKGSE